MINVKVNALNNAVECSCSVNGDLKHLEQEAITIITGIYFAIADKSKEAADEFLDTMKDELFEHVEKQIKSRRKKEDQKKAKESDSEFDDLIKKIDDLLGEIKGMSDED